MNNFVYEDKHICYLKEGDGTPIVLLHGFAEDHSVWKAQTDFLKQNFTVIVPDLPGSGQSDLLQKQNGDVLMEDYADCLYALLRHEQIGGAVVLGHSMGGYITLALAEKYPDIVWGFGFIHSTAFPDSPEKKEVRTKAIRTIGEYGSYSFVKSTTPNLFSKQYKAAHAEKIASLVEAGRHFAPEALQQYYKAMMLREDKTAILQQASVPVLFVMGEEDNAAPMADLLKQVPLPSIAYIHVLKGVGHMGMWECIDEVNDYIAAFVNDILKKDV